MEKVSLALHHFIFKRVLVDKVVTVVWTLQENMQQQVEELTKMQTSQRDIYKKKEVYLFLDAVK